LIELITDRPGHKFERRFHHRRVRAINHEGCLHFLGQEPQKFNDIGQLVAVRVRQTHIDDLGARPGLFSAYFGGFFKLARRRSFP
jgi:hypothetical protein